MTPRTGASAHRPAGSSDGRVLLGMAHHLDGLWLNLFGFRRPADRRWDAVGVILARVPVATLLEGDPLRDARYSAGGDGWTRNPGEAAVMFRPAVTEGGIHHDHPRGRFVATTYCTRTPDFMVATAPTLAGPWSEPVVVFRAREHDPVDKFLSYTFRIHPHLSPNPDTLVLTHVVNAKSLEDVLCRTDNYYPRFVKLDLRAV